MLIAEAESIASSATVSIGRAILVGAGPGDTELLTLKTVRALQAADVVLFDDVEQQSSMHIEDMGYSTHLKLSCNYPKTQTGVA